LFRFVRERRQEDGGAEARLFVASLLEAADLSSAPIYAVLTMRSDFLGDCSQFPGLPEALNRSQYLIPRMKREQIRDAIVKPLRLVDARMSARLIERLLNELGDDTGQLPVLQHALNRTFREYEKRGSQDEIGVDDYTAAGEMQGALDAHANSILASLRQEDAWLERWTEKVFRCLTAVESGRRVRRPTRLSRVYGVVGARDESLKARVRRVIEAYADRDHTMLVWTGRELGEDSVIDISHESLIEHWRQLNDWVTAEADAASLYQAAVEDAVRSRRGAAAKWRSLKLSEALSYLEQHVWNEAWAERLGDRDARFGEVNAFLEREEGAQRVEEAEKEARQARELAAERGKRKWVIVSGLLVVAVLGLGLAFALDSRARAFAENQRIQSENGRLQRVGAFDEQLNRYANQILDFHKRIDDAAANEKQGLEARLREVQNQQKQVQQQRDDTAAAVSVGDIVIPGTFQFDFDTGTITNGGRVDAWWEMETATLRALVPINGARIVNMGTVNFDNVSLAQLRGLNYTMVPIDGSDGTNVLVPGDVFAVETNEHNYAKVSVAGPFVPNKNHGLAIQWLTFPPKGGGTSTTTAGAP
jgi:hypothetical protein